MDSLPEVAIPAVTISTLIRLLGPASHPVRQTIVWAYLMLLLNTKIILILILLLLLLQLSFRRTSFYATRNGLVVSIWTVRLRFYYATSNPCRGSSHTSSLPTVQHRRPFLTRINRRTYPTACLPDLPRSRLQISCTPKLTIQTHPPMSLCSYYFHKLHIHQIYLPLPGFYYILV